MSSMDTAILYDRNHRVPRMNHLLVGLLLLDDSCGSTVDLNAPE